jgi:antitoxin component HigA of HigAB toxin-antitoxin module
MRTSKIPLRELLGDITPEEKVQTRLSFEISNKLCALMQERGMTKKQLAEAVGKRPSEVTRWLSGEHNFTIATLGMLSTFFGQPIVTVGKP